MLYHTIPYTLFFSKLLYFSSLFLSLLDQGDHVVSVEGVFPVISWNIGDFEIPMHKSDLSRETGTWTLSDNTKLNKAFALVQADGYCAARSLAMLCSFLGEDQEPAVHQALKKGDPTPFIHLIKTLLVALTMNNQEFDTIKWIYPAKPKLELLKRLFLHETIGTLYGLSFSDKGIVSPLEVLQARLDSFKKTASVHWTIFEFVLISVAIELDITFLGVPPISGYGDSVRNLLTKLPNLSVSSEVIDQALIDELLNMVKHDPNHLLCVALVNATHQWNPSPELPLNHWTPMMNLTDCSAGNQDVIYYNILYHTITHYIRLD